ncbi:NLPA lipoprotein [Methylobacterium sp. 4-46]|uniref:MetQ/NlpA family ABC transporter substrate-binding protein n=1 Tax=unclassified Methylobacterium TaxID=2615210 RepID=UPI000165CA55|nr:MULTISPECIES: MetQ/NlpA family ABC transporter substrate-binding protein [Methylobacterium]ACA16092.1 NLPA lipoprotein [Methylobacterium sp. 4-46]WFT81803.1 MetQ/NlpA family ABC transporter substrate-binding protein [Methylobacterium nodulans]
MRRQLLRFVAGLAVSGALAASAVLAASGVLAPASGARAGPDRPDLKVGFAPGPYEEAFRAGVEPILRAQGYRVQRLQFSTGLEVNAAVARGEVDANVMQHSVYLKAYNDRNGTDLVGIVQVPTPPMGLYSRKHRDAGAVRPGASVAVPNDPVNLERALKILRDLGWVRLRPNGNPVDVTELDVIANPAGIRLVPLEAAQAPRVLDDVDFAAIQGNFAIFSGLKLSEALALERMTSPYVNVVAVRRASAGTAWARDLVAAYRSDAFKAAIRADRFYDGFTLPDDFE